MKKAFAMAVVMALVIASAGLAAPAASTASAAGDANKVSWGFVAGTPTVQYNFTKDFSGQAGFIYTSGGGATNTAFLVEGSYSLMKAGSNDITLGGMYQAPASGISVISFTCGAKTYLNSNLELQLLLFPISITSAGGGSTTTIGGATIGAHLYL